MEGKRLIRWLRLANFLSYGEGREGIALEPLNVLIGPNCSGKSNMIAALGLLRAASNDLSTPILSGGGGSEWGWKGPGVGGPPTIHASVDFPLGPGPLNHCLCFQADGRQLTVLHEYIETAEPDVPDEDRRVFEGIRAVHATVLARTSASQRRGTARTRIKRSLQRDDLTLGQSILSQLRDPNQYPEITYLWRVYREVRLYVDWRLGRDTPVRMPQPADLPGDFLLEDASNLALVLNDLEHQPGVKQVLIENLRKVYPRLTDITGRVIGGTVLLYFHEEGLQQPLSAARASDGVLRFLCLLTILCHPSPPALICIEEPELGLHPDILPTVGELLIEASQRTQLIVTTHSDLLVSALSDVPEAVLVCERDEKGTHLQRLEKDKLKEWLDEYSLGDLWLRGQIGGTTT